MANSGGIVNQYGAQMTNLGSGLITNNAGGTITNTSGGYYAGGYVVAAGTVSGLINAGGATLDNGYGSAATLTNMDGGHLVNDGSQIVNQSNSTLVNTGGYIIGNLTNSTALTTLYNQNAASILNTGGAELVNQNGAQLQNTGSAITNESLVVNTQGYYNNGSYNSSNGYTTSGNAFSLTNSAIVTSGGGTFTNGDATSHGVIYNEDGAAFEISGVGSSFVNQNASLVINTGGYLQNGVDNGFTIGDWRPLGHLSTRPSALLREPRSPIPATPPSPMKTRRKWSWAVGPVSPIRVERCSTIMSGWSIYSRAAPSKTIPRLTITAAV